MTKKVEAPFGGVDPGAAHGSFAVAGPPLREDFIAAILGTLKVNLENGQLSAKSNTGRKRLKDLLDEWIKTFGQPLPRGLDLTRVKCRGCGCVRCLADFTDSAEDDWHYGKAGDEEWPLHRCRPEITGKCDRIED